MAVQLLLRRVLPSGLVQYCSQHSCVIAVKNTPVQDETLERAAAGIGLHVNADKTEYVYIYIYIYIYNRLKSNSIVFHTFDPQVSIIQHAWFFSTKKNSYSFFYSFFVSYEVRTISFNIFFVCYCYTYYEMTGQFLWFQLQMNSYSSNWNTPY